MLTAQLLHATLLALATGLALTLLAITLDSIVVWFDPRPRYAVTAAVWLCMIWIGVYRSIRLLAKPWHLHTIAKHVQHWRPELGQRWTTSLDLAGYHQHKGTGAPSLVQAVAHESAALAEIIDTRNLVDLSPLKRAATITAILAVILALTCSFTPGRILIMRLLMPGQPISLTHIQVLPGDAYAITNQPVTINATLAGPPRNHAQLFIRSPQVETISLPMTPNQDHTEFSLPVTITGQGLSYRVRAGDSQTPWHTITPTPKPRISEITYHLRQPQRGRLITQTQPFLPASLQTTEGSELSITFKTNKPLANAVIIINDQHHLPLQPDNQGFYHFACTVDNINQLSISLTDHHNFTNAPAPTCRLVITTPPVPDQPLQAANANEDHIASITDLLEQTSHIITLARDNAARAAAAPTAESRGRHNQQAINLAQRADDTLSEILLIPDTNTQTLIAGDIEYLRNELQSTVTENLDQTSTQGQSTPPLSNKLNDIIKTLDAVSRNWQDHHQQIKTARSVTAAADAHRQFIDVASATLTPGPENIDYQSLQNQLQQYRQLSDETWRQITDDPKLAEQWQRIAADDLLKQLIARQKQVSELLAGQSLPLSNPSITDITKLLDAYRRQQKLLASLGRDLQSTPFSTTTLPPLTSTQPTPLLPANPRARQDWNQFITTIRSRASDSTTSQYPTEYDAAISAYFQILTDHHRADYDDRVDRESHSPRSSND